MNTGKIHIHT